MAPVETIAIATDGRARFNRMTTSDTFEQIVRKHDSMLRRIASSYEARTHLAEELVQDIYFAIWRALPAYRGDAGLRTFVARIATNRAVTHVARALMVPPSACLDESMPAPGVGPEGQAMALDRREKLLAAVRTLPLAYRQTALLTLEGLTPTEIADVLGISTNAVAIRMSRAKGLLRQLIGDKQ
jgi:RNA polymerase sigma factor (sigma-70 family)